MLWNLFSKSRTSLQPHPGSSSESDRVVDLSLRTVLFLPLSFFDKTIPIAAGPSIIKSVETIPESPVDAVPEFPVDENPVPLWYCGVAKVSVVTALAACGAGALATTSWHIPAESRTYFVGLR